jgi:hypothetical protein
MKISTLYHVLLFCGLLIALGGCSDPDRPTPTTGRELLSLGKPAVNVDVTYGGIDDRIVFILLSHGLPGPPGGTNKNESNKRGTSFTRDGVSWDFKWTAKDGSKLDWQCEASSKGVGTLTIDGTKHDLSKGFIFLAARKGRGVIVKQVQQQTIAKNDIDASIKSFEQDDEITKFFSQE